jgi:hydrogenase assembly chaperone HypC/HupF
MLGAELISRAILQAPPSRTREPTAAQMPADGGGTLKDRVELIEMRILRETLTRHRWNKSRAAVELGLPRGPARQAGPLRHRRPLGPGVPKTRRTERCVWAFPAGSRPSPTTGRLMAMAEVSGVRREVNVACVAEADLQALVGQWALIHVGFAMALIDEDEAAEDARGLARPGRGAGNAGADGQSEKAPEGTLA